MTSLAHGPHEQVPRYTFLLGRVHAKIGGPTRTIWGYVSGLIAAGNEVTIAGIGSRFDMLESFSEIESAELVPVEGTFLRKLRGVYALYRRSGKSSPIVIVGVWHLPFFLMSAIHLVAKLIRLDGERRVVLIPTMSLTDYDWAKHARVKKTLRPVVAALLQSLTGVIFASSGELKHSSPATWRKSAVILHPTVSAKHSQPKPRLERNIDLLFVGRLDPQKDISLLFETFALMDRSRELDLVGEGDATYKEDLARLASALGIADRINWHGWKTHVETLDLLQASRVVIVTSLVENFCHVAVEALVSGCDVILVDRVMSAVDFSALADIDVAAPLASELAAKVGRRLDDWSDRYESRAADAIRVADECSPASAAEKLREFVLQAATIHLTRDIS